MNTTEPLQQQGYDFMAAAFEVYNEMGHGFTEDIYQESLENELADRSIPFVAQSEVPIFYKSRPLRRKLRPDLVVFGDIVVELKAVSALVPEHDAQILNYLKAAKKPVGYLVNFGNTRRLEWKRFARTRAISAN
ncbi:MAG TPA: GxxExxY protein [Opitutaceae bacterium]|nr:GxxExxY protein [Opitutaceae bacterium]